MKFFKPKLPIRVVELFAGVGGFRLGLEKSNFKVIWSNQWEPSTKKQHASMVYEARFGRENHSNEDLRKIVTTNIGQIPTHDLLVGGFPCQDYSIANTTNKAKGIQGNKGMLWWSIHKILQRKRPKHLFFENVDRLLKSSTNQKGLDFAIMLESLDDLGYAIEWRVINAADYGMPQARKRVFFIGYHKSTKAYKRIQNSKRENWLLKKGTIAKAFPVEKIGCIEEFNLKHCLFNLIYKLQKLKKASPFQNTGLLVDGKIYTTKTKPHYNGAKIVLGDILQHENIPSEFFINDNDIPKWTYLKGAKKLNRQSKDGFTYQYCEGNMTYPDRLDKPSRTVITTEGGKAPSRIKHVIQTKKGLRRLTPVELERLNMFPGNHTKLDGITNAKRAYLMGNALVVGLVEKIGVELYRHIRR